MSVDKTYINQVKAFLEEGSALITEEESKNSYVAAIEALNNAIEAIGDNDEKRAMAEDAATRWANQLSFLLFREGVLTSELEEKYRVLPHIQEKANAVKQFRDAREARVTEINEARAEIIAEQRELDIFQAIISGMTREEAETKLKEYEQKAAEAQQQVG